jgi:signal transduction histidine kinase
MTAQLSTTSEMVTHFQQLAEHDKAVLARELHDGLGGLLIGAVMDLDLMAPRIAVTDQTSQQKMARIRQALGSAIELARRITEELHPTLLDNVGLFSALRWQLRNACTKPPVKCIDDLPIAEPALSAHASIALFRVAQEALVVGLERGGVTEIRLAGSTEDGELSLQVAADGAPLPIDPSDLANLTLESMRHRVRALGGKVIVENPPQGGIVLTVNTPIKDIAVAQAL